MRNASTIDISLKCLSHDVGFLQSKFRFLMCGGLCCRAQEKLNEQSTLKCKWPISNFTHFNQNKLNNNLKLINVTDLLQ